MRRRRLNRSKSKKMFRKGASRAHRKNFTSSARIMRGGLRL